jgi:uncharacterized protein (DUF1697 family)
MATNTWIALFRGINVGGNNVLPMKSLPALLETCGCRGVQTYIQSGNVVFRSAPGDARTLARRIAEAVQASRGFQPRVIVLPRKELDRAIAASPFSEAEAEPKSVHLFFLSGPPQKSGLARLKALQAKSEAFELKGRVFYLHTPAGFGDSKLAAAIERALGVDATARNWRTCLKLRELAAAVGREA